MTFIPHIFHVTSGDILGGVMARCQRCPVALAIRRDVNTPVWVSAYRISIGLHEFDTPLAAAAFIRQFDATVARFNCEVVVGNSKCGITQCDPRERRGGMRGVGGKEAMSKKTEIWKIEDENERCDKAGWPIPFFVYADPSDHAKYTIVAKDAATATLDDLVELCDGDAENCDCHEFVGVHRKLAKMLTNKFGVKDARDVMLSIAKRRGLHGMQDE